MTRDDLMDVFLLLRGYWPHTAPEPDNETDVAVFWKELHDLELDAVAEAVAELAKTKEFCPPIGILAEAARTGGPKVPPYFDDYVEEDPALTGGDTLMGIPIPSSFPPDSPVPGYIAAARRHLEQVAEERDNNPNWRNRPAEQLKAEAAARTAQHEAALRTADEAVGR